MLLYIETYCILLYLTRINFFLYLRFINEIKLVCCSCIVSCVFLKATYCDDPLIVADLVSAALRNLLRFISYFWKAPESVREWLVVAITAQLGRFDLRFAGSEPCHEEGTSPGSGGCEACDLCRIAGPINKCLK